MTKVLLLNRKLLFSTFRPLPVSTTSKSLISPRSETTAFYNIQGLSCNRIVHHHCTRSLVGNFTKYCERWQGFASDTKRLQNVGGRNEVGEDEVASAGVAGDEVDVARGEVDEVASSVTKRILRHTVESREHLTPEMRLRLITERCRQWTATQEELVFPDPYWAFYWPGGQALTRYILDTRCLAGTHVLDVGTGCGASAIAAAMTGASLVVANDIDTVALNAAAINARINNVTNLHMTSHDLIGRDPSILTPVTCFLAPTKNSPPKWGIRRRSDSNETAPILNTVSSTSTNSTSGAISENFDQFCNKKLTGKVRPTKGDFSTKIIDGLSNYDETMQFDSILVGDMFYDERMTENILDWMTRLMNHNPRMRILMGEPGRPYFDEQVRRRFDKIAEYELPRQSRKENNGLVSAGVYQFIGM